MVVAEQQILYSATLPKTLALYNGVTLFVKAFHDQPNRLNQNSQKVIIKKSCKEKVKVKLVIKKKNVLK